MSQAQNKFRLFRRLSTITLLAIYLLILVGGIVRSTGSGMGCPDWPKCFGSWVPPTAEDQLPADYRQTYAQQRAEKNDRLAQYIKALGFPQLAFRISNDPGIMQEAEFNAVKTWTEYINRLVGAVIGLLVLATFAASWAYRQCDLTITILSFVAVLAVGFQGWIGSVVVSTNLLPWMVTIHMLLALVIVCLLTYVVVRSKAEETHVASVRVPGVINITLVAALILTLAQIILGTQVRESVNEVAQTLPGQREQWINNLDWVFYIHRSYSLLVLAVHLFLLYKVHRIFGKQGNLTGWAMVLCMTIGLEMLTGAVMAYFDIPRFAQPIHLLLAMIAFGLQFWLILRLNHRRQEVKSVLPLKNKEYVSY